jgi:hypothetical protein
MGPSFAHGRPGGRARGLALTVCVLSAVQASGQPVSLPEVPTPFGTYVRIEGWKHPELIPEHLAWASALRSVASLPDHAWQRTIQRELGLGAEDLALVYEAARGQTDRDARCRERQEARTRELQQAGATFEELLLAMKPIVLSCRQEVIDARDALLGALSADGQRSLSVWVDRRRENIAALVPKGELEEFKKPQ